MPRKPAQQPATAYDYRRAISLLQVIARVDDDAERLDALHEYAAGWNVNLTPEMSESAIVRVLAEYVLAHGRDEWK
jgi:hypothetical protein